MINIDEPIQEFTLFGGPLQRLGGRLGLVRGANTFWLGVALGVLAWSVLVVLAVLQGIGDKCFSLAVAGMHVRFLVAIPLFFLCETWVGPRMADFVRDLVRNGIVPESGRPALAAVVRRVDRLKDPWAAEIVFLLAVLAFAFIEPASLPGRTANWQLLRAEAGGSLGLLLGWYFWFCLPLFQFLLLRWIWHLGLWWHLLWRVQGLDLNLVPTHPDSSGGLGYLEVVQEHFSVLVMAFSSVIAASAAEGLSTGSITFEGLYRLIPMFLALVAVLFMGPLFIFSSKLWRCRVTGWSDYMGLASRYVQAFDRKWIRGENEGGESLLGTADMQSLADLNNSVNVVRAMRWVPTSRRLVINLAVSALLPLLPLILFKYPVSAVASRLFKTLTGF